MTQEAVAVSHTQNVVLCIIQDKKSIIMCRNSGIYIYLSRDWKIDHITKSKFDIIHSWKKGCYAKEWGTNPYFICVWSQRAGWLAGCMVFLWIVCTICLMCILEYLWCHIGETDCMSIARCHWVVIVVNLVKHTWFCVWCCLLLWFCDCQVSFGYSRLKLPNVPLCVVACLIQSIPGVLQEFLSIYPAGLGGTHHDYGAGCPYWWLHIPNHPKCVL